MRDFSIMGRAHTHADVEINIPLCGGPLRYLHAGRIVEVPAGKLALFWGGIPHQLLSTASGCEGILITLPLPWMLQWEMPEPLTQRLLSGDLLLEESVPEETAGFRRWVEDFESGNAVRRKVALLEIQARLHRLALGMSRRPKKTTSLVLAGGEARMEAITRHINALPKTCAPHQHRVIKRPKTLKQITPSTVALPHDGPGQPDTIIGIREQGRYAFDCAQGCAQD
jgi:hypothetical protein